MACSSTTRFGAGQSGSALIESVVSAAILLLALVGLFAALDGQTAASDVAKSSSAAAGLAEADQERLRSFRVADLANRHEVRTVTVAGEPFTVDSRVDWIRDATGGTETCANASSQADYLRLTSTVSGRASGGERGAPVRLRSLVAPPVGQFGPGQGTLAIKTTGGAGQPVQGVSTSVSGPVTLSDTSNEVGCAVFAYVPVGAYDVRVSSPGFVDPSGNPEAVGSATATEGTTNLTSLQYDRAATVEVRFDTQRGAAEPTSSDATSLSAANAGIPGTGLRLFTPSTPQPLITATGLFPYMTPYTLYSGSCAAANPATYDPAYFDTHPGSLVAGAGSITSVVVREPSLRLDVQAATAGAAVRVVARPGPGGEGCESFSWSMTAGPDGLVTLPDAGVPFGRYAVCAEAEGQTRTLPEVGVTGPTGSERQLIDLRAETTAGACA
ncbi:MAG: Type secretory pathway, pseudopilin PulG [Solirubrobacterales bacterium]|jgi:hypothetical protein|nr:Type secretory pathway, pseudopilin PulG [Solirubrobacterales bacterium]